MQRSNQNAEDTGNWKKASQAGFSWMLTTAVSVSAFLHWYHIGRDLINTEVHSKLTARMDISESHQILPEELEKLRSQIAENRLTNYQTVSQLQRSLDRLISKIETIEKELQKITTGAKQSYE